MNYRYFLLSILFLLPQTASAQRPAGDTVVVQTLTFDSIGRAGAFHFPDTGTFEKVIMQYTMRCHHALVSNGTHTEQGCGQWDYNCETYLWDSTRTDSLQSIAPSAIVWNYPSNTNFPYTTSPTHSIIRRDEKVVRYPLGTTFTANSTDDGGETTYRNSYQRILFDLPAYMVATIEKGNREVSLVLRDVTGIDTLRDMTIRLLKAKPGSFQPQDISTDTGFVEVYHATTVLTPGSDTLSFYNPFAWDSTSDVVVDLSYSGMSGTPLTLERSDSTAWVSGTNSENALNFASSERIPVPNAALNTLSRAITIAFWAYGDTSYLPGSNTVFCEGLDAAGHRQINIHLPWGDNNVYWDCGGDSTGNFDRIQKSATKLDAAGRWNYWAFTKDATTGKMAIYLNGSLWMSDTGKHRLIDATQMTLGGAISSSFGYFGEVRQAAIFNHALDSSQIQAMMLNDSAILPLNPITYFPLNEGSGSTLANLAPGMPAATLVGAPAWRSVRGSELPNDFSLSHAPQITLLQPQTSATPQITDRYTFDTIPDNAHIVMNYRIGHNYGFHQNDTVVTVDTVYGDYLATKSYTYDETGKKIDSVNVAARDTVRPTNLYYWSRSPQKFELMSFVTPYGIGLDLGPAGKTWDFDVTDYLPIMKGWRRLTMERGSQQEEFNLRFLFIKGTPARNVLDMQQLWPMTEESYQTIQSNLRYPPLRVYLNPAAKGYKIRSYITGHGGTPNGLNGEFTPQWHDIFVNQTNYRRLVYKICSLDPLYPQGGTWTLNRAGWCPGMATDLAEYEITGTVTPGDTATIDYNVEGGVGDSRYDPSTQLVSYGPPNFSLNASIEDIERPSAMIAYARINPACDAPIVLIRNNGSQTLRSLTFEYYVDGGKHLTYTWTGNLPFLDTASVTLPIDSLNFWTSQDSGTFHVDISAPNGGTDEYDPDDHASSTYTQPPQYTGIVVVNLRTNNDPQDNYYEVLDDAGNTVFSNDGFAATTSYFDSLILPVGCYTLVFHDDGEDGLSYWANPAQGTGYLELKQTSRTGKALHIFNPDFGKGVQYDFSIVSSPLAVGATRPVVQHIGLYPDPTANQLNVDLEGMPTGMITLDVTDALGRTLRREQRFTDALGSLHAGMNIQGMTAGNYFLRITTSVGETTREFVVK